MPTVTNYHWSTVFDCVKHETDGSGNTIVTYTHEPGQFGPLISENRDTGWMGQTVDDWSSLGVNDWGSLPVFNPTEYCHHYDAVGSTTMLTDDTGAVTDTFQYDAWGNVVARTGTTATPCQWVGRWGYHSNTPTGDYYVRERSYEPAVARWRSVDPKLSLAILWQPPYRLYAYSPANPVLFIDPTGLSPIALHEAEAMFALTVETLAKESSLSPKCPSPSARAGFKFGFKGAWPCGSKFGILVQLVHFTCSRADCGAKITTQEHSYYEWTTINKDDKTFILDIASHRDSGRGTYDQTGEMHFYCLPPKKGQTQTEFDLTNREYGEIQDQDWVFGGKHGTGNCETSSLSARSKSADDGFAPTFWTRTAKGSTAQREFRMVWCCCIKPDVALATADPKPA